MKQCQIGMFERGLALLIVLALAGCAAAPNQVAQAPEAVFYPSLPNAPRIQHLATIASERDISPPSEGLAKFVLGDETNLGALQQPYGLAMFGGKLYVADSRAQGLAVFDMAKRKYSLFSGVGGGRMKRPINVKIDRDGTKYVTDTGRDQILVYDRDDRFVSAFGADGQFKPVDAVISADRLYVVDIQHHSVQVLDKRTGKFLFSFGKAGSGQGELYHPTNIAIGPEGDVYVVETSNYRVQRFTADGKSVRVYGEVGNEPGTFARPKGIALDRLGRMYVGDAAFENVQVFDNGGKLLLFFGQTGDKLEGLNLPAGVTIDYDNVEFFRRSADPRFNVEYLILVASQFGPNKIDVFGFGRMKGVDYPPDDLSAGKPAS